MKLWKKGEVIILSLKTLNPCNSFIFQYFFLKFGMLIQNCLFYHLDMIFVYKKEYFFGYKGKTKIWRPSWILGPKTQCSLHFEFGKHLQLFRRHNKVLKKYNQSCPPGGVNRGYYGILEYDGLLFIN